MVGLPSNQFHHPAFSAPRLYTPVPHTAALPIKWVIGRLSSSSFRMISSEAQEVRSMRVRFTPSSKHKNDQLFMSPVVLSAESCLIVLKRMQFEI